MSRIMTTMETEGCIFEEEMKLKLLLECDGDKGEIFSGNIESFDMNYHSYGFDGMIQFSVFDGEPFDQFFAKEKPVEVTLTFERESSKGESSQIELKGIATDRSYTPIGKGVEKKVLRLYTLSFSDNAKATWGMHYPIKIYVDKSMKEVIDGEKNPLISLSYDWEQLNETHPIHAFSLEYQGELPEESQVSFYSFMTWYLQKEGGILEYNYNEHNYKIVGKKGEEGDPIKVAEWWINYPKCDYPKPLRAAPRVLKHNPENLEKEEGQEENAFQSVHKDRFDSGSYTEFVEQNPQEVKSIPQRKDLQVTFSLKQFSKTFSLEELVPGTFFTFNGDEKTGGKWCDDPAFKGKTFRIREVKAKGKKISFSVGMQKLIEPFDLDIQIIGELKEETHIPRPSFNPPVYPFSILGKVSSEIGDKQQTTFNIIKKEGLANGHYEVLVPLGGKEKKIPVPFSPDFASGQNYFPYNKNQQLLLSIYFQTSKVKQVVDFQPLVQLPNGEQGCGTVYASKGKDEYFRQIHVYKDKKYSTFTLERSDTAELKYTILFSEKKISITSEEKEKFTAATVLDIEKGVTTTYSDKQGGVTQETTYNKEAIAHISKGNDGTSTISQKPDSIVIHCKKFQLDCDEAEFLAKKTITKNAKSKVIIDSPLIDLKGTVKLGG